MEKFYAKFALKWPFYWSKWWLKPEQINTLSPDRQLAYFERVSPTEETVCAMSRNAKELLVQKRPQIFLNLGAINIIKMDDDFFELLLNKQENMSSEDKSKLSEYTKQGTLPKTQTEIFAKYLAQNAKDDEAAHGWLANLFYEYIERCGLNKETIKRILSTECSDVFKQKIRQAQGVYSQKCTVKHLYDLEDSHAQDLWDMFCKDASAIYTTSQEVMSVRQYEIFIRNGLHLDEVAILRILKHHPDYLGMAHLIFRHEPKHGILNREIEATVRDNPKLMNVLATEILLTITHQ